jgi:hypothetical protein
VKYVPPEEWILTLGSLIAKCHVKDFKLNEADPGTGKFVNIRDGSVRWPDLRAALEQIGPLTLFRTLNTQLSTINLTAGSPSRAATSPPRDTFLCRNPGSSTTVAN